MNLPNKLTVLRVLMIPLFLVLFYALPGMAGYLAALAVFALAALTDLLDGKLARAHGLITDFGKLMDPLADKLLVMAAMICFVREDWASSVAVIVILAREFLVTSVRLLAAGHGKVLAADLWGKIKTVLQIIWVLYTLVIMWADSNFWTAAMTVGGVNIAFWGVVVLQALVVLMTVLSGFNYLWKNRELLADTK